MNRRKVDVSTGAGGLVTVWRTQFDSHISQCPLAQSLWRNICIQAMVQHGGKS